MQAYEIYMMSNYLTINGLIAVIGLLAAVSLTRRMNAFVGFLIALPMIVLICAVVVGGFYIQFTSGRAVSAFISDPSGGSAFLLESGIEFGLLGALLAVIGYLLERVRQWLTGTRKERMKSAVNADLASPD